MKDILGIVPLGEAIGRTAGALVTRFDKNASQSTINQADFDLGRGGPGMRVDIASLAAVRGGARGAAIDRSAAVDRVALSSSSRTSAPRPPTATEARQSSIVTAEGGGKALTAEISPSPKSTMASDINAGSASAPIVNETLSPASFGQTTIAENPVLLGRWNDAMRSAASSSRSNGYTRYLDSLARGKVPNQKMLEEAFGAVNSRFIPSARASGFNVAEVHHWNFGKIDSPKGIVDSRGLVPVDSRALHQQIHTATSDSSNIWDGKIAPQHQIQADDWLTKLPPWK